jgi:hypothetical protein
MKVRAAESIVELVKRQELKIVQRAVLTATLRYALCDIGYQHCCGAAGPDMCKDWPNNYAQW